MRDIFISHYLHAFLIGFILGEKWIFSYALKFLTIDPSFFNVANLDRPLIFDFMVVHDNLEQ